MRVFVMAASALVFLAGCGGIGRPSDKQALVATCIEKGEAEATCNCVATALETNLPPELFKKVAQAAGRDKQDMMQYMSTLPVDELMAFSTVTNDIVACSTSTPAGG